MSLKTLLMPLVSQHLLSAQRLLKLRARAERQRLREGQKHVLHYFHQVDDPYSALAAQALPQLLARYDGLSVALHVVGPPDAAAAPERDKLIAYSRQDAQRLAHHYGLDFSDPGVQPNEGAVEWASRLLVAAASGPQPLDDALVAGVSQWLWANPAGTQADAIARGRVMVPSGAVAAHLRAAEAMRRRLGHYLGVTFFYGGEWYWGIDRIYHLEQRLQALGVGRPGTERYLFAPSQDLGWARVRPMCCPLWRAFGLKARMPAATVDCE